MTLRFITTCAIVLVVLSVFGCEVTTESQPPIPYQPANHFVINEVYTLPLSNPNAHSWLELFNPTTRVIDLKKWSIAFQTRRYQQRTLIWYRVVIDSNAVPPKSVQAFRFESRLTPDSVAVYDVPLMRATDSIQATIYLLPVVPDTILQTKIADTTRSVRVAPNQFFTLVSDLDRLRVYNNIGPGEGPEPVSTPLLPMENPVFRVAVFQRDTTTPRIERPDTVYGYLYDFFLNQSDQIVLKDSSGQASDVVRYGNYTFTGPGTDPYPTYQSIGVVPQFESIARYAGAYDTRNTANDFYITRPGLRPIPHWLSQLWKK